MAPEQGHRRQIELYRQMTGEQRRQIVINRHALSCDMAREGIRHQHADAEDEEVEQLLRERIRAGRV